MFLDPSHRNETFSISGNLGAKATISSFPGYSSVCQLESFKNQRHGLGLSQRIFKIPLSCGTPSDSVTLRVDTLPGWGQPSRTAGFLKPREAACETPDVLAAQQEPTWSVRPGEAPLRRDNALPSSGGPTGTQELQQGASDLPHCP